MERLTKNNKELNCCCGKPIPKECININCSEAMQCSGLRNVIEKLAEYENTGLEPKEVEKLKQENIRYISTINGDLCPKIIKLKHELEKYKNGFEKFIDELATKDCEYEGIMSGWDKGGYGPYPKYRQKYEELQGRVLAQAEKELKGEQDDTKNR